MVRRASEPGPQSPLDPDPPPPPTVKPADDIPPAGVHRRRNTLPSIAVAPHEAEMLDAALAGPNEPSTGKEPGPSSGTPRPKAAKRRSRSADAFRDGLRDHQMSPIQWRRRSDEIETWRTSVLADPAGGRASPAPPNYTKPDPPGEAGTRPSGEVPRTATRESLKYFDFGSFGVAGANSASVEQRLTTLEVKVIDHEYAIAKLQGFEVAKPIISSGALQHRVMQDLFQDVDLPRPLSQPRQSLLSSPVDSLLLAENPEDPGRPNRSSAATTIRPATALVQPTATAADQPLQKLVTAEQFDSLMALVASEQAARQALEAQVAQLQSELELLRGSQVVTSQPGAYPTPSPESRPSPVALRGDLDTPQEQQQQQQQQPEPPEQEQQQHHLPRLRVPSDETSRFSLTSDEDDESDDGLFDVYETPQQSQGHGLGVGHEPGGTSPWPGGMI